MNQKHLKIFSANANPGVAAQIAQQLGVTLGDAAVSTFSDGEISVSINETVRGCDVYLVQPTSYPINDHLMELLIMIDACKRASAARITAVIPYFGYARQDRKSKARDPISAKLVADLITVAGADRVLTMDLHAAQIQGFFNIPVDHLLGVPVLAPYFAEKFAAAGDTLTVVSPDLGSVTRARGFAARLDVPLAIVDKRRPRANVCEVMNIIGDVKGRSVILVDDMVDTAGTLCSAAQAVMDAGAAQVYACATHGVLSGPALERIHLSPIRELVLLDTISAPDHRLYDKIRFLSCAPLFAAAIERIHTDQPVSTLYT